MAQYPILNILPSHLVTLLLWELQSARVNVIKRLFMNEFRKKNVSVEESCAAVWILFKCANSC